MGHTVYPMREMLYSKIEQLKKLACALREPEKKIAFELIEDVLQNISAITYANPLPKDIEDNMVYAMLLQEKKKLKNSSIDDLTLLVLSIMVNYKKNPNKNESSIYRLLRPGK